MNSLDSLYQQVILDHAKKRSGEGTVKSMQFTSYQVNPTCGDQVTLGVTVDDTRKLTQVVWEGEGCSISQASLSMMVEALADVDVDYVTKMYGHMETMMHSVGRGIDDQILDDLGDSAALEGTSKFPNRIKCALLGWYALRDAMAKAGFDIVPDIPGDIDDGGTDE